MQAYLKMKLTIYICQAKCSKRNLIYLFTYLFKTRTSGSDEKVEYTPIENIFQLLMFNY